MTSKPVLSALAAAFVLFFAAPLMAQTTRIAGVVRDETGSPIRGAIVHGEMAGGTSYGLTAATDDRGRFILMAPRSGDWLVTFEAPGFNTMTLPASVRSGDAAPSLDVKLERDENPEANGVLAGIDIKALNLQLATADGLMDQGQYDQAIAAYRDIRTKAPSLKLVNLQLGNAYLMKKSYPDAETAYQEILKADAADANGMFAMGRLKEAEGNAAEARDWYQKASTADGRWTKPLMKLAMLSGGDKPAAGRYLAKVIEIDPTSADAIQALALQKQ